MSSTEHCDGQAVSLVIRGLVALAPLTDEEEAAVRVLARGGISLKPGDEVGRNWPQSSRMALILSGWACEQRHLANGGRQIFSILLPGDFVEVPSEHYLVAALTPVRLADALPRVEVPPQTDLSRLVCAAQRLKTNRLFDHLARLGQMNAYERMSHFLLELHDRLTILGQVDENGFLLPTSQEVIGGALGLTTVHVNRTLKQLRADGYVSSSRGRVVLHNLRKLSQIADYSPLPACEGLYAGEERHPRQSELVETSASIAA
jgi:CRP-like cAMP-binding protein